MSFRVTCLCVIATQDIWGMTLHSVKNINFRCFTPVRRPSYRCTADSMGLSSLKFSYLAPKDASFLHQVRIDHSRSSKVDDFGTNRKRIWYFLLVRHSNQGSILICCNFLVENCKFFLSYSHVAPLFGCSIWYFVPLWWSLPRRS